MSVYAVGCVRGYLACDMAAPGETCPVCHRRGAGFGEHTIPCIGEESTALLNSLSRNSLSRLNTVTGGVKR